MPHLSGDRKEDDVIIVPNMPLISGNSYVKSLGFFAELGYKAILASTTPKEFHNLTIAQLMNGYEDKFVKLLSKVKWDFNPEDVGILAQRRDMNKKPLTVFTGINDFEKAGEVFSFMNKTKLDIWKSDDCNEATGSDGVLFGPSLVQQKKDVKIYVPDFARAMPLVFDREENYEGKRLFRYKAIDNLFSSLESNRNNKYYCELKSMKEKHIDGLMSISDSIVGNPPILISNPHFLEGDQKLFEHIEGLNPNKSLHEIWFYLHPRLSIQLYGTTRTQFNIKVSRYGNYYKNIPNDIILPLAWIESTLEYSSEEVKSRIYFATVIVDYIEIVIKLSSFICFLISILYLIINCNSYIKLFRKSNV